MKTNVKRLLLIGFSCLLSYACSNDGVSNNLTNNSNVPTTLESTVIPVFASTYPPRILPNEVSKYSAYGYGNYYWGAGVGYQKRLDLMPFSYTGFSVTSQSHLLHFFTMSDIHLMDVQSPAQVLYDGLTNAGTASAYSPTMLYTTQVLDVAIQTVNQLNDKNKIDFGMFLGDDINNAQYNELRMFIDILDGKFINPNSDPLLNTKVDYMQPFQAVGLNKSIPWYQVIGNHDHFWEGSFTPNNYILQSLIGTNVVNLGELLKGETLDSRGRYMGVIDGSTEYGVVVKAGLEENFPTPPQINANAERHYINKIDYISEFSNSSSNPVGHGIANNSMPACYTFEPKSEIPIKVIVFDDTEEEDCAVGKGSIGRITQERYNWLVNELDKGESEGKLMIIAAHIPIGISSGLFDPTSSPSQTELIAKLQTYSNLILWISGHVHRNKVTPFPSPDSNHPEYGFWEVETASLRDFPQMFRLFDIVRNSDNTISIFAENINPAISLSSLAAKSRSYSIAAVDLFTGELITPIYLPTGAYNAELIKQLSPEMQEKIKNY